MKEVTIKLYSINELKDEAFRKAIDQNRDYLTSDFDFYAPEITEEAKADWEKLGYNNIKIMYNGFYSQGDGACFTASVDVAKWLEAHGKKEEYGHVYNRAEDVEITISHNWRYYFATSTTVDWTTYSEDAELEEYTAEIVKMIEDEREELGNKLYKQLEELYSSLSEEDALVDHFEANEVMFTEDGTLWRGYDI